MPRYVGQRTFPDGLAIRVVASRNGLPVNGISEVRVLDPYFHH